MDSLATKSNPKDILKALDHLPATIDGVYDDAMARISKLSEEDAVLAKKMRFLQRRSLG